MVVYTIGYSVQIQPVEATLISQIVAAGLPAPTSVLIGSTLPYDVEMGFDTELTAPQQVTLDGVIVTNYTAAVPVALPLPFVYNVRNKVRWQKAPDTTLMDIVAIGTNAMPTMSGTVAVLAGATGQWAQYTSLAAIGASAGWVGPAGFNQTQRRYRPSIGATVRTPADLTSQCAWVGFCSADPAGADDPVGAHLAALRYSTAVGDVTWKLCTKDGAALTVFDTGLPVVANTRYEIAISISDQVERAIILQIADGTGAGATLVVPATDCTSPAVAQNLGIVAQTTTLVLASRSFGISYVEVETA